MAGGRLIATGTRLNGERVEIRTPYVKMGLDYYDAGTGVNAEMTAMDIRVTGLIPFEDIETDPQTGVMSVRDGPTIEDGLGHSALDGLDILQNPDK